MTDGGDAAATDGGDRFVSADGAFSLLTLNDSTHFHYTDTYTARIYLSRPVAAHRFAVDS